MYMDRNTVNEIWVSTNGSDQNIGTKNKPMRTIQAAVESAAPDTTIFIREGVYHESVVISNGVNLALRDTTPSAPLRLVSADGMGAATIAAPDHPSGDRAKNLSAVSIFGPANVEVNGFRLLANGDAANDSGGVKIIGGADYANDSGNIHLTENIFSGNGIDAIKVTKTEDINIEGNVFEGDFSQEIIDAISVIDMRIVDNNFRGESGSGVALKGGVQQVAIERNYFNFTSDDGRGPAIKIGGELIGVNSPTPPPPFSGFEAKDVLVRHNVVENSGAYAVMFQGARDSVVRQNHFANDGEAAIRIAYSRSTPAWIQNRDNRAAENSLADGLALTDVQGGATNDGWIAWGNSTGSLSDVEFAFGAGVATALDSGVELVVVAGGTGPAAAPPRFEVFADGVSLGARAIAAPRSDGVNLANDDHFREYLFRAPEPWPSRVEVVFADDGNRGGVDINLFVDAIEIGGVRYEAETAGVFSPDSGNRALGGARESLYVNGILSFSDLPNAETNAAPMIAPVAGVAITEGETAQFVVSATDADGQSPTLSAALFDASGVAVDPARYAFTDRGDGDGVFVWNTTLADDGVYSALITADDGAAQSQRSVTLDIAADGYPPIVVRVGGAGTAGDPPKFRLLVDGVSQGVGSVSSPLSAGPFKRNDDSLYEDVAFDLSGPVADSIEIVFFNDGRSGGVDRNLYIDYIDVNGARLEAETEARVIADSGNARLGGAREDINVNGVMIFDDVADLF